MKNLFLLCFLSLTLGVVYGQPFQGSLQALKSTKLSNTYVHALAEDEDGFLWIGTQKGLNRYNGSSYRIYEHRDSLSLSSDNVLSLCADSLHRLWVGTDAGINLIQYGKVVRRPKPEVNFVFAMDSYDKDYLIFSNNTGLALYNKNTGEVRDSVVAEVDAANSQYIHCDGAYIYLASLRSPVVYVYSRDFKLHKTLHLPYGSVINNVTTNLNNLYVSTSQGLFCYAVANGDFMQRDLYPLLKELTQGANILFTYVDPSSLLFYVGVADKGLFSYDIVSGRLLRLSSSDEFEDIHYSVALMTPQNLWLSKNHNAPEIFPLRSSQNTIIFSLNQGEKINQIVSYGYNVVLARTVKNLYAYDAMTQQIRNVTPKDLGKDQYLGKVLVDDEQNLWMSVDQNRIRKYAWNDGELKLLKDIRIEGSITDIQLNGGNGIYLLQTDKVVTLDEEGRVCGTSMIPSTMSSRLFTQSNKGNIYLLDFDFVYLLSSQGQFVKIPLGILLPYCFYEADDGKLWVGTFKSGLYCCDKNTKEVRHFSTENGLPDNTVRAILGDGKGNIWVSMRDQLSRISPSGTVTTYENKMVNSFYAGDCSARDGFGNLYFGGDNFMTCILANGEPYVENDIPLYLDGIIVNDELRDDNGKGLVLDYDQNQLSIYYSALYFNPDVSLNYSYMLEGYNRDWVFAGRSEYALFPDLPSGDYRFRVRVQNPSGEWNANELVLPVRIKPHPLLSPWAKAVYAVIAVLLVLLAVWKSVRYKRKKEEQLVRETKRAMNEQLKQEKIDFFINISHEFRTPLSLIYAPARELAASNAVAPAGRRLLETIEHNAERMMRLSEQLLHFNKIDFEGKQLAVGQNDLSLLVNAAVENIHFLAEQKDLRLSVQTPDGQTGYYDTEKVEKVLYNLLSNAIKYTPGNGSIAVQLNGISAGQAKVLYKDLAVPPGYEGRYAEISVSDTGPGIPLQKMGTLFRRYERGVDTEGAPVGFGIGLDYAMQLAVLHKGMLRVTSEVGKGSCFYFAFPIEKEAYGKEELWEDRTSAVPGDQAPCPKEAGAPSEADRTTVLLVEDDADMRAYLQGLLGKEYNVLTATNGVEAMDGLSMALPDLIVSDVMMPYKDGLTLCNEIKNNAELCHLPVILLTAKAEADDIMRGLNYGADAYVRKPFDPQYLLVVIRNVLANRKRLQAVISHISTPLESDAGEKLGLNPQDQEFLNRLYELADRFLDNEDFNIGSIAGELNISYSCFYSKIRTLTGESPKSFLGTYRLNRAMELLKTRQYTVSEVCYKVGFGSLSGFSRSFRKKFGIPPSDVGK